MEDNLVSENIENKKTKKMTVRQIFFLVFWILVILVVYKIIISSPKDSKNTIIHITAGESLRNITLNLKEEKVIKNPVLLQSFVIFFKNDKQISKGDYLFNKGTNIIKVAWMLARGNHNLKPLKITFPEGSTNEDIANIIMKQIPDFDKNLFLSKTKEKQGYLFPDTYFIFPLTTQEEIVSDLSSNFKNKINSLKEEIENSKYKLSEIIIMASIIEGEAKGKNDAPIISGILWKRLEKGIPLQVDVDRWTYKNKGLPPSPISNPGFLSIKASVNPTSSPYLYYLHDKNGIIHYAKTYTEHKQNIAKFLK